MCQIHGLFHPNILSSCSLLVTILEGFHFDHDTLNREMEAAKTRAKEGEHTPAERPGNSDCSRHLTVHGITAPV